MYPGWPIHDYLHWAAAAGRRCVYHDDGGGGGGPLICDVTLSQYCSNSHWL